MYYHVVFSSQVQQRHSDAGEPEEMTPNVAYASFVMSPHSGKEEDAYEEYIWNMQLDYDDEVTLLLITVTTVVYVLSAYSVITYSLATAIDGSSKMLLSVSL